ncbi:hypothetical protein [Aeromicrobium sp. UC242_57]|uniref:hypothetical protein n=1 Tax=Aeromicrobium sp. UC242_57 TaxID=3374624 RepID=UPI00378EB4E3
MTTTLQTQPRRVRRSFLVVAAAVIVVGAGLVAAKVVGSEDVVPYTDPQSAGRLTLCDATGSAVTSGKVDARPFAAYVLGETALGEQYAPDGAVAALYAYQPRAGVEAREFSGNTLTKASLLADAARPAVRLTKESTSLADFTAAFPAEHEGYVQLRVYLGTPAAGTLTTEKYDTADLKIDGDEWKLVAGGQQSCSGAASAVAD